MKSIITNSESNDMNEWKFPQFDLSSIHTKATDLMSHKNEFDKIENVQPVLQIEKSELENRILEVEALKIQLNDNIMIVNNIVNNLNAQVEKSGSEISELLLQIVRNAIKKLILKEINIKPETITSIIDNLKELISEKNGLYTVYLSEYDFTNLQQANEANGHSIKPSQDLQQGDVVIKSHHAEIRSILDERLEKMLDLYVDKDKQ